MAAQQFGYQPQRLGFGYSVPTQRQPALSQRTLALAASGRASATDPFGLGTIPQPGHTLLDTGTAAPKSITPVSPTQPGVTPSSTTAQQPTTPGGTPSAGGAGFDINTDPALQGANAFLGMNDQQAQAQALKLKQQLLTGYGDPKLAAALLGQNDPFVEAAGKNPTSTLAQLRGQNERDTTQRTEGYNKANLFYSGARVKGEQQAGEEYQNQLAQAAAAVNGGIAGIEGNLLSALGQSNGQRASALQDAYSRDKLQAGVPAAGGTADTTAAPGGFDVASTANAGSSTNPVVAALLRGAAPAGDAAANAPIDPLIAALLRGAGQAGRQAAVVPRLV